VQETDGGVFFQMETIALTRRVPFGWGWLVNPYIERIPKQSLSSLLGATRKAVMDGRQPSAVSRQAKANRRGNEDAERSKIFSRRLTQIDAEKSRSCQPSGKSKTKTKTNHNG
jgi:hypothetical protein